MPGNDPLGARLFGYGVPYRAVIAADGRVEPLPTDPAREAFDLAAELEHLADLPTAGATAVEPDSWVVSVPFGRCGVDGLPREHLAVFHADLAYLDVVDEHGSAEHALAEGEIFTILPGMVVRLRARPRRGHRALVRFQTEDQTPLLGNAAPYSTEGAVPDAYDGRLRQTHQAFAALHSRGQACPDACRDDLATFFGAMSERIAGNDEIRSTREEARRRGAYDVDDEVESGRRQLRLLDRDVIGRIRNCDPELFRFPGMFGGITTLFNLLD